MGCNVVVPCAAVAGVAAMRQHMLGFLEAAQHAGALDLGSLKR